jgi:hypothetical protein
MTASTEERVRQLIVKIQAVKEIITDEDHPTLPKPFVYRCAVKPSSEWHRPHIEEVFQVTLPDDLVEIWNQSSGVELYKEINYAALGLIIWSPEETLKGHPYSLSWMGEERFRKGDLIVGEFLECDDLIILRCDAKSEDFGNLIISRALDPRKWWKFADTSIITFLEKASASMNYDYWAGPNGW